MSAMNIYDYAYSKCGHPHAINGVLQGRAFINRVKPAEWVLDTFVFMTLICPKCGAMQMNVTQEGMAYLQSELAKQGYKVG